LANNKLNFDAVVVGCGFSGAVIARQLAENGRRVVILEKRGHIAGNMYDSADENGILVHRYGPHIFHTSDARVFNFLRRFSGFLPYEHRVLGHIDGQLVPIPFNFRSAELLFGDSRAAKFKAAISAAFGEQSRVSVTDLISSGDPEIREAGSFIFEKVFLNYTSKQWGMPPEQVDRSVLSRVPVVLGYDDCYFSDLIQCMPAQGYTKLFKNLLSHDNITVELNCDAQSLIFADTKTGILNFDSQPLKVPVIWTAPADELFGCIFGRLPYRSLELVLESPAVTQFQPAAVVNYPNDEQFTRITEFKQLTGQNLEGVTTIMKEYPLDYNPQSKQGSLPYYPIINSQNLELYRRYSETAEKFANLHLCGRLAEYKYYNMDAAVSAALSLADKIIGA
jgi:UDP-galactopyranose mutase